MSGGTVMPSLCVVCGGHVSRFCTLCLGEPDPAVTVEQIARGVAQVDRAVRGTR
jgi:hypothetical protein